MKAYVYKFHFSPHYKVLLEDGVVIYYTNNTGSNSRFWKRSAYSEASLKANATLVATLNNFTIK